MSIENKTEDFGKQKCWGSIGWGLFSMFIGWLVDVFSVNKNEKNYSPVFYSGIILMVFDLFVSTKIQVHHILLQNIAYSFKINYIFSNVLIFLGQGNKQIEREIKKYSWTV